MEISWTLFVLASLVVIATPGQDMILILSRSLALGIPAGLATAAGVSIGLVGHTLLATFGVGAILRASEALFMAMKFAGAAYLVWLGLTLLFSKHSAPPGQAKGRRSMRRLFADGVISNVANPKIVIFFFAFLPQFVSPAAAHPELSVLAMGLVFAVMTFALTGPIALSAGALSAWLRSRPSALGWIYRCSGMVMIGLGVKLAFEKRPA